MDKVFARRAPTASRRCTILMSLMHQNKAHSFYISASIAVIFMPCRAAVDTSLTPKEILSREAIVALGSRPADTGAHLYPFR